MSNVSTDAFLPGLSFAGEHIRRLTGLVFPEGRRDELSAGLARGMKTAGTVDLTAYLGRLEEDSELLDDLVAEITIAETYFLRDSAQCRVIRDQILPALFRDRPTVTEHLRVWSAGCASGEEPYTLAILLSQLGKEDSARIVGTDLARRALARARRGRYGKWSLRGVPPEVVSRYFQPRGEEFVLLPELRRMVEFRYLNLAVDSYPSLASGIWQMDLILCRNVLIYFDEETVARVTRRLLDALAPHGWLVVGASDPPPSKFAPCDVVVTEAGLAYRPRGRVPRIQSGPAGFAGGTTAVGGKAWAAPAPVYVASDRAEPFVAASAYVTADRTEAVNDNRASAETADRETSEEGVDAETCVAHVRSLANAGDLEAAGRACAAALDRHRTSAELTYLHGLLLGEAGRSTEAAAALRACLYLDRSLVVAHLALAGALTRVGDRKNAARSLRNAESLLAPLPPDAEVPASGGERVGRLAAATQVQLAILAAEIA